MAGMEPAKRIRSLPVASLLAMWMAAAGGSPAHAGTIHVYRGQSIQAAIAVASNGDKILVHPGTFKEAVNLLGKAIAVESTGGAGVTTIDATGLNTSVVSFSGAEGPLTVVDGFTLTGGAGTVVYGKRRGGGMYCNSNATVVDCIFTGNSADMGGGIYCGPTKFVTSPSLTGCTFIGNTAGEQGGGLFVGDSDPTITRCKIIGNRSGKDGGGVMFGNDNFTTMVNCLIDGNTAADNGGGMNCIFSFNMKLTNCTFAGNSAGKLGGGLFKDWDTYITLTSCIFRDNSDIGGKDESAQIHIFNPRGPLVINTSCVQGWTGLLGGSGNTGKDPRFVDADGPDNKVGTLDDDLRLLPGSPCIDAGDNSMVPPAVSTDLAGKARFVDDPYTPDSGVGSAPVVDQGAYEYFHVNGTLPLEADVFSLSAAVGGRVGFSLDAGKGNANRFYWIVMGLSGRSPGTSLPGGRVTLPLNWDAYTVFSIHLVNSFMFVKFMGSLDRNGAAGAIFNLPPIPGAGGQAATFAFALVDGWDYVSNAVPINIVH